MSTSTQEKILKWISTLWTSETRPVRITRDLVLGLVLGCTLSLASASSAWYWQGRRMKRALAHIPPRPIELRSDEVVNGVVGLIGNTPLLRINSLSDALGVEILGKAEHLNPGGSVKDRVALKILQDAEENGLLHPHTGSTVFEGTVGSTGISFALLCRAMGYECSIIMPDDVAIEKVDLLEKLGAAVERVRPASIVDEKQFVNLAKSRALAFGQTNLTDSLDRRGRDGDIDDIVVTTQTDPREAMHVAGRGMELAAGGGDVDRRPRGFFADQFENHSNFEAHRLGTGPEIWRQTSGRIDAFVSGAGTGGTIAGVASFLRSMSPEVRIVLADPEGSGLYNKIKYGVLFDPKEREGTKRRHQVDTVVEGIGINRLTANFELGRELINDAYRVTDAEAVAMSRHLVKVDGLYLGSSAACNLVACVRLAKTMTAGSVIVTILCDSGSRHQSKFWSDDYLRRNGIPISDDISAMLARSA